MALALHMVLQFFMSAPSDGCKFLKKVGIFG